MNGTLFAGAPTRSPAPIHSFAKPSTSRDVTPISRAFTFFFIMTWCKSLAGQILYVQSVLVLYVFFPWKYQRVFTLLDLTFPHFSFVTLTALCLCGCGRLNPILRDNILHFFNEYKVANGDSSKSQRNAEEVHVFPHMQSDASLPLRLCQNWTFVIKKNK